MHNSRKVKSTQIWSPRKTNETNCLKVKTWEWFDLTILKIKQIHYKRIEVFTKDLTLNLFLPPVVIYWHDHEQAPNSRIPPLLDLQNTNSHVCDFEIPIKSFKSLLVDLAATRFHQHLIVDLVPINTCRVRRYRTSQISQE